MASAWLRFRSYQLCLALSVLVALVLSPNRLLGAPGVESALVFGVALPPFVAAFGARWALGRAGDRVTVALVAAGLGAMTLAPALVIQGLHLLVYGSCSPLQGLAFMALGPGLGCALAGLSGAFVASLLPSLPRVATAISAALPIAALGLGVAEFWSTPAIFVFGSFGGWFPGTIYDQGVEIQPRYLSYRAVTLCWAGLLVAVLHACREAGRVRLRWLFAPSWASLAVAALGTVVAVCYQQGPALGHRTTVEHIAEALGSTTVGHRCIVYAPREMDARSRDLLVRDCSFRVARAEEALGVREPEKVRAFFFRSAEEKQWHMGAARTYIAKPWRGEVYLQQRAWPHPVLAHEVVHVIARNAARGPFAVGGQLDGWLPDPALIEGVAVAAAWDIRGGLTPHQWARAMVELEQMPPLASIVGLGFLGQPAANAYTISGSFLRFVLDEYGSGAVAEAYATGDVEAATGRSLDVLEAQWRARIAEEPLPPEALARAEFRFSGSSVFSAVCPHRVARLKTALAGDFAAGDLHGAVATCEDILRVDPADEVTRAQLIGALSWLGREEQVQELLPQVEDAPEAITAIAEERLANAAWHRGDEEEAEARYRALLDRPLEEGMARSIEVRLLGLEAGGRQAALLLDLLVGQSARPASSPVAVHIARELQAERSDGLGHYLEARQLMFAVDYDRALPMLQEATHRGLATERLRREARRMEVLLLVARRQYEDAERFLRAWRSESESPPVVAEIADWSARVAWERTSR